MSANYSIRKATIDDVAIIAHHRVAMFQDIGSFDDAALDAMDKAYRVWLAENISAGLYHGWFAVSGDQVMAGAGLWLHEWFASPMDTHPLRGYICNVYTERRYRRQGIARRLVEEAISYCREQGIHIVALHASTEGRPIYESLGFTLTNEMRLIL